ncbi:hypothetical protein C8F04DRAFT_1110272 [Mycena alexandri]|uniref:Uncharacterized protein n=1 Tax=Mycena alexandri TaxID=1745969 RepID=A0AAD6SPV9_9AGAR|nr:hypothetical protein C8F04DRAFT_1110272 [Mycena alexandri]
MTSTNTQPKSSASVGTKLKGGVQVAKGMADTVRGTTGAAIDSIEKRDSSLNDDMVRRGRVEIEQGISMIKGHAVDTGAHNATANNNGPGGSLQGWGSGINGDNANATTNTTGFPPPKGQEYAQNSTTANANANMNSDLGRGSNAYSGGNVDQQPPQYPNPGGPPPQDYKGMGHTNPTQMGNRPAGDGMVGEHGYQQRQDADQTFH